MTMDEIKASDRDDLTLADIAEAIHADQQAIRMQARTDPAALGFPVSVIGTRVKVPRIPFLQFWGRLDA